MFEVKKFINKLDLANNLDDYILSNLDDIIPFLSFFGLEGDIVKNLNEINLKLSKGFVPFGHYLFSHRMDETMGGFLLLYELTGNVKVKQILDNQNNLIKTYIDLGYIPGYFNLNTNTHSKIVFTRGLNIVETILESDYFNDSEKYRYIELVKQFIDNNKFFNDNSLFLNKYKVHGNRFCGKHTTFFDKINIPETSMYFTSFIGEKISKNVLDYTNYSGVKIMKDNSNFIFSIIESYKFTNEEYFKKVLKKWIYDGVLQSNFDDRGFIYTYLGSKNNVTLTQNFTFLDILLDYLYFVDNKDNYILNIAKKITGYWLNKKDINGSVLEEISGNKYFFIDSNVDFSISLMKIYKITGNSYYKKEGNKIYEAILKNFFKEGLFKTRIDINGFSLDTKNSVKYNILFLKSYIAYNYPKEDIFSSLFKDR